jgi:hypothetical protein
MIELQKKIVVMLATTKSVRRNTMKQILSRLVIMFFTLTSLSFSATLYAADSCSALLRVGIYNISQSSGANQGELLATSTFCQADYSNTATSSAVQAAIKASFLSWFSGGASGGVTNSQIIQTQHNVCTLGYNSSAYSNQASSYSKTIYQGALDAWNMCNALATQGVKFEIQADNTMQGVAVSLSTTATGTSAKFLGLTQTGTGTSVCKNTTSTGQVITVADNTVADLSSAGKYTVVCKRNLRADSNGNLFADAQTLFFNTSTGAYQVPLSGIGALTRSTVDQVKSNIQNTLQSRLAKWTPITKTSLGVLPFNTLETVIYNIPNSVPATAKEVLIYAYARTFPSIGNGVIEFKIFTDENSVEFSQYLHAYAYGQGSVPYNSDNIWLPITSSRTIKVTSSGLPVSGSYGVNYSGDISVLGYR